MKDVKGRYLVGNYCFLKNIHSVGDLLKGVMCLVIALSKVFLNYYVTYYLVYFLLVNFFNDYYHCVVNSCSH